MLRPISSVAMGYPSRTLTQSGQRLRCTRHQAFHNTWGYEMLLHLNADERQYCLHRKAWMIFSNIRPKAAASDFAPGHVGMVRKSLGHCAENIARGLAALLLVASASCTGSPKTLEAPPQFEVTTPAGVASVSIRQSLPEMTDDEFTQLVRGAMQRASPGSILSGPVVAPFPLRRIVWHVEPTPARGGSTVMVNVFEGADAYAYEEETVVSGAPPGAIEYALVSMSERLFNDIRDRSRN